MDRLDDVFSFPEILLLVPLLVLLVVLLVGLGEVPRRRLELRPVVWDVAVADAEGPLLDAVGFRFGGVVSSMVIFWRISCTSPLRSNKS